VHKDSFNLCIAIIIYVWYNLIKVKDSATADKGRRRKGAVKMTKCTKCGTEINSDFKDKFNAWCKDQGTTPSDELRRYITKLTKNTREENNMFANLKDGQITVNEYRFALASATTQEDLLKSYYGNSDECLAASIDDIDAIKKAIAAWPLEDID
jgi:hypothetical protein